MLSVPVQAPMARIRLAGWKEDCTMARIPGDQQCRGDSLHRSSGEDLDTGTGSARHRGDPEPGDSPDVGTPATEAVTQRPAEQDQRCQGQGVATEDPLEARQIGSQVAADRGQRR